MKPNRNFPTRSRIPPPGVGRIFIPGPTNAARASIMGTGNGLNVNGGPQGGPLPGLPAGVQYNPYQVTSVNLGATFTNTEIDLIGTTIWCQYATYSTAYCLCSFQLNSNPQIFLYPTMKMDGFPFTKLFLTNPAIQNDASNNPVILYLFTCVDLNAANPVLSSES